MRYRRWSRIPTDAEIANFNGLHCRSLYRQCLRAKWSCPSCGRTAIECIRWSHIRNTILRREYGDEYGMGFTISLTRHHCHGGGRFREAIICGDCNSADGAAKRKLRLPKYWSFAPSEIRLFVAVMPYSGRTSIDYRRALKIFKEAAKEVA